MSPSPTPAPPANRAPGDWSWQSRPVQIALAFLLGIAATLAGMRLFGGHFTRPIEFDPLHRSAYRVDLNRASPEVLRQLPRIGPAMSDRIVAARPFETEDDLRRVPGFGPITVERITPHVTLGESTVTTSAKQSLELIDPNIASLDELQRIPGIGPKMAQRIVDERERKSFTRIEDLRRVYGVGPKTLEKLRPYLTFEKMTD